MTYILFLWLCVSGATVVMITLGRRQLWGPMFGGIAAILFLGYMAMRATREAEGYFPNQWFLLYFAWFAVGVVAEALARAVRERIWRRAALEVVLLAIFIYWAVGYTTVK